MNIMEYFQRVTRQPTYHIRWMLRRDKEDVLDTERRSFEFPWSEMDFERCLRQRNVIGMVAEYDDHAVGYMVYELHKNHMHVLNFAVMPELCREGVGTAMMAKLIGKLSHRRRTRISLEVRETNVTAQLFFRAMGFRAVATLRDFYRDTSEDAYLFDFHVRETT